MLDPLLVPGEVMDRVGTENLGVTRLDIFCSLSSKVVVTIECTYLLYYRTVYIRVGESLKVSIRNGHFLPLDPPPSCPPSP